MKNAFWVRSTVPVVFLCIIFPSLAQDNVLAPSGKDSSAYNKVMIIPFNPDMYFSDSDRDLAEHNNKTADEVRKIFRYGLNYNVHARILTKYNVRSLLNDTSADVNKDLLAIYKSVDYRYETPTSADTAGNKKKLAGLLPPLNKDNSTEDPPTPASGTKAQLAGSYLAPSAGSKYMHVVVHNPEMLRYLSQKYETDLFIFINQFELKTNYEKCLDRTTGSFTREVWVHFSIYNPDGKLLLGDVAKVFFPVNTNDLDVIIRENFPLVADYLSDRIPAGNRP